MDDDKKKRLEAAITPNRLVGGSGFTSHNTGYSGRPLPVAKTEIARNPPDWTLWADMLYVSMEGAVELSLNLDPEQWFNPDKERLANPGDEARRRLRIALQRANSEGLWRHLVDRSGLRDEDREVILPKFGAFAASLGWELPDRFPGKPRPEVPFAAGNQMAVSGTPEIDPSDRPPELDAANMAFRAVTNGYGDQAATFRNRLLTYVREHYPHLKNEAVERIATVANPDKDPGRKGRKD